MSLVDFVTARELSYAAARAKDSGKRCDIEAGMAKLLAARAAWSNADAALQIHGGNGYALEYEISRIRSEEHTSELQSLMRNSYAVFCLKKQSKVKTIHDSSAESKSALQSLN